jgi:hypothetical protein
VWYKIRGQVKYDLSSLTDFNKVPSVVLSRILWNINGPSPAPIDVYRVSNNTWDPRTVTWNTRPDLGAFLGRSSADESLVFLTAWNLSLHRNDLVKIDKGDNLLSLAVIAPTDTGSLVQYLNFYLIATTDTPDSKTY